MLVTGGQAVGAGALSLRDMISTSKPSKRMRRS
jgi:hypothetical protein